jgi:succinate dehydrogenase / fumarate reductase cytochrome b subunit
MNLLKRVWRSSLGKKYVMAISGAALLLFVIGHMVGNLQIFLPPEAINRYGHFLQSNIEILWPVRIGLLVLVLAHIVAAIQVSAENKAARPMGYLSSRPYAASLGSRTMLMSGLIILTFIIYHMLHYTVQVKAANLTGIDFSQLKDAEGRHDVYAMLIYGFSKPAVSLFYVIAMGLLCLHLSHGASAMFQSLGWKNHVYGPWIENAAKVVAILIFVGYVSIPVAVMLGHGSDYLRSIEKSVGGRAVAASRTAR